jgi:hypothetical protein
MVLGLLILLPALALFALYLTDDGPTAVRTSQVTRASHPPLFFSVPTFFDAVREAESAPQPEGPVVGGVIPHHWLAGSLITGFFRGLANGDEVRTVVLFGPDHRNAGSAYALTSDLAWETRFGLIEPDLEMIRSLVASDVLEIEDAVLTSEHSVAGIMPAIRYYLPDARVVPIILSSKTSLAEARHLGEALAERGGSGTVFVAAVDFSHYLVQSQAERHDEVTLEILRSSDPAALFGLDSSYLDSPPSIATLMSAMATLGTDEFVLLENTNSGAIKHDELAPTTSYIVGYYPRSGLSPEKQGQSER